MINLFDMFRAGIGPPSSYTVGPMKAGKQFVDGLVEKGLLDSITHVVADVYGSLSLTGKSHHVDIAIIMGPAGNEPTIVGIDSIPGFIRDVEKRERLLLAQGRYGVDLPRDSRMRFHNGNLPLHRNGMQVRACDGGEVIYSRTYYPIGGGFIVGEEHFGQDAANGVGAPYPFKSVIELLAHCNETGFSLSGLAMQDGLALHSKKKIDKYFVHVWQTMQACIDRGMNTEGVLSDPLRMPRRVSALRRILVSSDKLSNDPANVTDWVNMFVLAINEKNVAGDHVVIVPINGAYGTVPTVLVYYDHFIESASPDIHTRYSMAADAIDTPYKINASISGVEIGRQGEVSVACPMAAMGLAELLDDSPEQVCMAVEIDMGHNLGLTCDPVTGQAQMSCIKRNAIASVKAINAIRMALCRISTPRIPLDKVIEAMYRTGKDMNAKHRETSRGSLAIKVQRD